MTGHIHKHMPVHALSVLTAADLRDLSMQLDSWQAHVSVHRQVWFDIAYEHCQVDREITRRRELLSPPKPIVSTLREERDPGDGKRLDFTASHNRTLALAAVKVVASLDRTIEVHGNETQMQRWSFDDQRCVWKECAAFLSGAELESAKREALRCLVSSMINNLENDELRMRAGNSFRTVLNKRISLLSEIVKRVEEPRPQGSGKGVAQ